MYIQGHIDIINEILPEDYFDLNYPKFNKKKLLQGLKYNDAPCGKYSIKDDKVIVKSKKLCQFNNFIQLFYENKYGESIMFQNHKGYFAHLHAMTTDPDNNIEKIRNKIIVSILGYCLMAIYDQDFDLDNATIKPNSLWIGMVLHIITDSYSPAHTIRDKRIIIKKIPIKNEIDNNKRIRLDVHEHIKTLAKDKDLLLKTDFIKLIINDDSKQFVLNNRLELWNAYKSYKFEYDLNNVIKQMLVINPIYTVIGNERRGDIITFQYFENQSTLLHSKLDLLSYVKDTPLLYNRMNKECLYILNEYKEAIISGNVAKFLKNVLDHMLTETFRIHSKYLNNKTNIIVA
jgi:hypothetical protein